MGVTHLYLLVIRKKLDKVSWTKHKALTGSSQGYDSDILLSACPNFITLIWFCLNHTGDCTLHWFEFCSL